MKILLTGGTGFLGRRIVSELSGRHALRLLVRRGSSRRAVPGGRRVRRGGRHRPPEPRPGAGGVRRGDPRGGPGQDPRPAP